MSLPEKYQLAAFLDSFGDLVLLGIIIFSCYTGTVLKSFYILVFTIFHLITLYLTQTESVMY